MSDNFIKYFSIFVIIILIAILYYFLPTTLLDRPQACINEICFNIELAKTQEERQRGLMHRQSLDENSGMFFIFDNEDLHSFWMKNTLVPLDIIWINKENKIVHIEHNVPPCIADPCSSYTPKEKAIYVLEVNGGLAEEYNFRESGTVTIIGLFQ